MLYGPRSRHRILTDEGLPFTGGSVGGFEYCEFTVIDGSYHVPGVTREREVGLKTELARDGRHHLTALTATSELGTVEQRLERRRLVPL